MTDIQSKTTSRRDFLKVFGVGVAAIGAATVVNTQGPAVKKAYGDTARVGILFDASACVGCHYCEGACAKTNDLLGEVTFDVSALDGTVYPKGLLPYEAIQASKAEEDVTVDDRDANRWIRVVELELEADEISIDIRHSCTHCGKCAEVCPSGALSWRDDGIVSVDSSRCIGCKYCYQACPFDIPRFSDVEGDRTIRKCTMCATRIDEGQPPACVEACPAGALTFGNWDELVATGEGIVSRLKNEGYSEATLYGKDELGGMGLLYVLPLGTRASNMPQLKLY